MEYVENPKFVNLTPHPIILYDETGSKIMEIPPSGQVARVETRQKVVKTIRFDFDGYITTVPIRKTEYGDIVGLPDPQPNTIYIVSTVVLVALRAKGIERDDVVSPDTNNAIRDEQGRIIGVKGFQVL